MAQTPPKHKLTKLRHKKRTSIGLRGTPRNKHQKRRSKKHGYRKQGRP